MLKNLILDSYQAKVFNHYMNISEYDIKYCLQTKSNKVRNPMRLDKHPSVGFLIYKNNEGIKVLYCKDFADDRYVGDCFKIAGRMLRLNSDRGEDFIKILKHIVVNVIFKGDVPDSYKVGLPEIQSIYSGKDFKVTSHLSFSYMGSSRNFTNYWKRLLYYDVETILKENFVYDPLNVYVDDKLVHIQSRNIENLAILYYLGNYQSSDIFKLYKPYTKYKGDKFKTNNKFVIEALHELKGNDFLILTKSRKDCIVLRSIIKRLNITKIDVISVNTESVVFKDSFTLPYILEKYLKIYSIFDYDNVGVPYMFYNYIVNDIIPIVIQSDKDIDEDRCRFILDKIYYESGLQYDLEEMFEILNRYIYSVTIPDYTGKDISDMVSTNKNYSLGFITNILNNIIYEENCVE